MTREEYINGVAQQFYDMGYRAGDKEELRKDYALTPYELEVIVRYLIEREREE